jgi:hypothetical protein
MVSTFTNYLLLLTFIYLTCAHKQKNQPKEVSEVKDSRPQTPQSNKPLTFPYDVLPYLNQQNPSFPSNKKTAGFTFRAKSSTSTYG